MLISIKDSSSVCMILSSGASPSRDPGGSLTKAIPRFCPVLSWNVVYHFYLPDTSWSETSQLLLTEFPHKILFIFLCTDCSKPCLYPACVFQIIFSLFCCTAVWIGSDWVKKITPHPGFMLWQGAGKLFLGGRGEQGSLDICHSLKLLFLVLWRL